MRKTILAIILFSLLGCSTVDFQDETSGWSAEKLYAEAKSDLNTGDYESAIRYYEILEARYPFEIFAQQAQLDMIYAYYRYEEPESALAAADRFIKIYPRHTKVDYAYYLKGLINFERDIGLLDRFLPLDRSQRDQTALRQSFRDFSELVTRFPESPYSQDARQRMLYLRNALAQHELSVAQFYMRRKAYLAAANRAKIVIANYQRTPAVPGALLVLAKAYKVMGLNTLYDSTLRVFKLNYPDHKGISQLEALVITDS